MEEIFQDLYPYITTIIVTIGGGLLTTAGVYISLFFKQLQAQAKEKAELIKDEKLRAKTNDAIDNLSQLIDTNILNAKNTIVKELELANEDGKITREELKAIAPKVRDNVLNQMGAETFGILNNYYGDLTEYIEAKIEENLEKIKKEALEKEAELLKSKAESLLETEKVSNQDLFNINK